MNDLKNAIQAAIRQLYSVEVTPLISRTDAQFGDFSTNIAMQLAVQLQQAPRDISQAIVENIQAQNYNWLASISVAGPGFINFTLDDAELYSQLTTEIAQVYAGKRIVVEYSCPNAFKELHAGHLYQTVEGDVIARLIAYSGGEVYRTNFGGDVGLHVAKAMCGIVSLLGGEIPDSLARIATSERSQFLSKAYVAGAKAYEEDQTAKTQIETYNQAIYALHKSGDTTSNFAQIYWTCRQWSYDYFDNFYQRIQVDPFRYIPESTAMEPGLTLVRQGLIDGIFENSDGAVIYRGENDGLHTRVFITQAGLPTYETKDIGVISIEFNDYHFDHRTLITGRDQAEYMKVVYAAAGALIPAVKGNMTHLAHGLIRFGDGKKMSSRLGNVTSATDVLNIVAALIPEDTDDAKRNAIMLSAIKYAFLKQRLGGDIAFDPESSVSLHGSSGPYLQYALVRARSILAKIEGAISTEYQGAYEQPERLLAGKLAEFTESVSVSATEYAPHHLANYLYELASIFNTFYEKNRVIGEQRSVIRLQLVQQYANVLDKGLEILGIERLERM